VICDLANVTVRDSCGSIGENVMQDDDDLASSARALRIDAGTKICESKEKDDAYERMLVRITDEKIKEKGESNGSDRFLIHIV
jgi:hypothetical protein